MEMLVTGIKVRPARTPEPAATDRRTHREPRSVRRKKNARRDARDIFSLVRARGTRAMRVATDRHFVSLAARRSW
jgi:hypothetical protein